MSDDASLKQQVRLKAIRKKVDAEAMRASLPSRHPEYYLAHVCFDCRKSFKRTPRPGTAACPDCGEPVIEMGRNFKAPKKTDLKSWDRTKALWLQGERFGARYPAYKD